MDQPTTEEPRGRFQYSLRGLFLFTTSFAVFCALTKMSPGLGILFLVLCGFVEAVVTGRWLYALPTILCLAGLLFLVLRPSVSSRYPSGTRWPCQDNARQINLALLEYLKQHQTFPPAYIADENGKPMHSWRVLILPYLGRQDLFDAYDFNEPWDGPNNRKLADKCPNLFRCPSDRAAGSPLQNTSYVAVVGPHAAWTGATGVTPKDFKDGLSNTILVVELSDSGINWMEPRDLDMAQMARTINPPAGQGISSKHADGAHAAFADGHVRFLRNNLPSKTLEALLTRDGGETVDPNAF